MRHGAGSRPGLAWQGPSGDGRQAGVQSGVGGARGTLCPPGGGGGCSASTGAPTGSSAHTPLQPPAPSQLAGAPDEQLSHGGGGAERHDGGQRVWVPADEAAGSKGACVWGACGSRSALGQARGGRLQARSCPPRARQAKKPALFSSEHMARPAGVVSRRGAAAGAHLSAGPSWPAVSRPSREKDAEKVVTYRICIG